MADEWKDIEGWLSDAEANKLQELARDKVVVEFGTWKGKSAICMAEVAKRVITVDHFKGDAYAGPYDVSAETTYNIAHCPYNDRILIAVSSFEEGLAYVTEHRPWFIYYDADHAPGVTFDVLEQLHDVVPPSHIIGVHDYGHSLMPHVKEEVDRWASLRRYDIEVTGTLACLYYISHEDCC